MFYICNNVNALIVHHPKKTALKLPALGNGTVQKQHKGPVRVRLLYCNSKKTTFEPVDFAEHHAGFDIQFILMMSKSDLFCFKFFHHYVKKKTKNVLEFQAL